MKSTTITKTTQSFKAREKKNVVTEGRVTSRFSIYLMPFFLVQFWTFIYIRLLPDDSGGRAGVVAETLASHHYGPFFDPRDRHAVRI